ncbi:uncharacterized protein METZ01_LOCUS425255, partial [marine metagenome]
MPKVSEFALATVKDGGKTLGSVHHCFVPLIDIKAAQPVAQTTIICSQVIVFQGCR